MQRKLRIWATLNAAFLAIMAGFICRIDAQSVGTERHKQQSSQFLLNICRELQLEITQRGRLEIHEL
jgi:hypothetical protein